MENLSHRIIDFNKSLHYSGSLPPGIKMMNPFVENEEVLGVMRQFYNKFYNDRRPRYFIIGINPGRFGAGQTGVPFTDSRHLLKYCGIPIQSVKSHEPSAVFIYELIEKFGGPALFYSRFYINSVCPLGFVRQNARGNWVNCNYYDQPALYTAVREFMIDCMKKQFSMGLNREVCFVLGKKNARFVKEINQEAGLFNQMVVLDHPRYVQQYRSKEKEQYLAHFIHQLTAGVFNQP